VADYYVLEETPEYGRHWIAIINGSVTGPIDATGTEGMELGCYGGIEGSQYLGKDMPTGQPRPPRFRDVHIWRH
jgi:hypothetical protein